MLTCDKIQFLCDMHAQISILRDIIYGSVPYGADVNRVCSALELDPADLNDSERFAAYKQAAEVWDVVLAETGNDRLGLLLGEKMSPSIIGMIGYLMQSSRTLHEALLVLARFNDLHSTMLKYQVVEGSDRVTVQYIPSTLWEHQYPESVRQSIDLAMSALITFFQAIAATSVHPISVELRGEARHREEYERVFNGEVRFKAERYALTFVKQHLLAPVNSYDRSLFARFDEMLSRKLQQLNATEKFSDKIGQAILLDFKGNSPAVEVMAAYLNTTPRTIQRRLKEENTTYREIASRFKKELAAVVLENSKFSVGEVAGLLGYSDSSALRKAMKRWER